MLWDEHLPAQYLGLALIPVVFERFDEPEAQAVKCMGYNSLKQCCFYRHQFTLTRAVMDEDESFHEEETYFEEVRAWRLENGSWLRRTVTGGEAGNCRSRNLRPVYEIVADRPR